MPTPYDLRSPESIAEEYGGNKQKIGAAVQAGLLDPTAAVLAGMFIDRVRGAAMAEQAAPSTVAQDALAPAAGLGAAMPPSMGAVPPPQGAAPPPGAGAVPAGPAMPQGGPQMPQQMPQGMARGGLTSLNVPDTMYDYAGGGIVAFAEGDEVEERLRLRPVDSLADAYVFLQERGAEIPEDMSEEAIIRYANRVREMENMEVRDAGVRVSPEDISGRVQTGFPALFRDYGSGGRGDVMPETRLDATTQMPMEGGEFAPGFSPVAPTERGLPGLMAPEGPAPERAVPFLGQMMENVIPSAQAAEDMPPAELSLSAEEARQIMTENAPSWYDVSGRSDTQVIGDAMKLLSGGTRTRWQEQAEQERIAKRDAGEEGTPFSGLGDSISNLIGRFTQPNPFLKNAGAMPAVAGQTVLNAASGVRSEPPPFGSTQMDEVKRMFPTMATSPAPNAAADQADFLNQNILARGVENYSLSPSMPTAAEMGFSAAEEPPPSAGLAAITPKPAETPAQAIAKQAGLFGSDQEKALAMAEFGARLMSGTSPYALQNFGTAATGTLESLREQRKTAADRELKERMLGIEERKADKEKDTDFRRKLDIKKKRLLSEDPTMSDIMAEDLAAKEIVNEEARVQAGRAEALSARSAAQTDLDYLKQAQELYPMLRADMLSEDPKVRRAAEEQLLAVANRLKARAGISTGSGGISATLGGNATDIMSRADAILGQ